MTDEKRLTIKDARAQLADIGYSLRKTGYSDELRIAPRSGTEEQREACAYYTNDLADAVATARFEHSRKVLSDGALSATFERIVQAAPFTSELQPEGRDPETDREYPGERLINRFAGMTGQDDTNNDHER